MTWVGGSLGAAGFKAVYWLSCGVWPDTALYGLVPDAALGPLWAESGAGGPDSWLLGLLRLDILTVILLAPPILLLPFLVGRLLTRHPKPFLLRLRHPFAPPSRDRGSNTARAGNPSMSLATVYKTLAVLKTAGQVLELEFSDRDNRYDGNRPEPHPHCICQGCGAILDPDLTSLDALASLAARQTGFRIQSLRLDFYGLCPACQARRAAASGNKPA